MKKLISVLSATALLTSSTASVISCGNDAYWNEFNRAVKNQETFMVYIGADDCEYCNHFEDSKKITGDLVQELLDGLIAKYKADLTTLGDKVEVDDLTGFGQAIKVPDQVKLREFIIEAKADNFNEKWSKNILNWVRDQLREIYYTKEFKYNVDNGNGEVNARNQVNAAVKSYLDNAKGTPFFLMIRNGKLAGISSGYSRTSPINHDEDIRNWFETFKNFFLADDLSNQIVNLIKNSSGSSSGGEEASETAEGATTAKNSKKAKPTTKPAVKPAAAKPVKTAKNKLTYDYSQLNLLNYM
ncbi:hypothetical protein SCLARK_00807 [Spiroplasma clarkii]|uniref:Lipoprotein n=1 Tax=Spiroplasma clarkii TaxID=2139 RepID=A0A1Y0L0B3_9MOLU|nr:lipoprotein [Spiroplasma clarkii]ARU91436.1 hypothetical protein SCLARK_00807 [Spiroplasma clarkii]ATX70853.1 hypothetical protein SCLAR_v1c05340 [Spiroplasma clarkii]